MLSTRGDDGVFNLIAEGRLLDDFLLPVHSQAHTESDASLDHTPISNRMA